MIITSVISTVIFITITNATIVIVFLLLFVFVFILIWLPFRPCFWRSYS